MDEKRYFLREEQPQLAEVLPDEEDLVLPSTAKTLLSSELKDEELNKRNDPLLAQLSAAGDDDDGDTLLNPNQDHTSKRLSLAELEEELVAKAPELPITVQRQRMMESSRVVREETRKWYEMPEVQLTAEQARDVRIVENRQYLDPKRFYKSSGSGRSAGELPTRVQFGTVVVGAHEFYSGRLNRRERRGRIIDEVLADRTVVKRVQRRSDGISKKRTEGRRVIDPAAKAMKRKGRK